MYLPLSNPLIEQSITLESSTLERTIVTTYSTAVWTLIDKGCWKRFLSICPVLPNNLYFASFDSDERSWSDSASCCCFSNCLVI